MQTLDQLLADRPIFSVETGQCVADVVHTMAALNVGAILVLEGGELRGLFSERDLMVRVVLTGRDVASTAIDDVMTRELATATPADTTEGAMSKMERVGCRHLPVVDGSRVVGMVSMRDLMSLHLDEKTSELEHMRSYIQSAC
ncbi:MAG: CBS domain-containing protein [Bryobacterales bacterium]|nr:CBS domain-containing protein [Bryobacterales bacterium]